MYQIAICDDSPIILEQLQAMLKSFPEGPELLIKAFSSGMELERALQLGQQYDLIILDVELGDMSGVQIAELVRNQLRELYTPVLYISAHSDHSIKLHQTRPLNFLVKPIKSSELHDCLLKAMELYAASKDYFDFVIEKKHRRILSCTIQYFESRNKRILIYTTGESLSCYGKLTDIKQQLSADFIMIHKSYLVNRNFIDKIERNSLTLSSGQLLPISRNYRNQVYNALLK